LLLVAFLLVNAPNYQLSLVLASVVQGDAVNCNSTQQTTSLMYTETTLSCHIRNRFMPTTLACPISRLRGEWDYTTVQRLHQRHTRSHGTEGWKDD